MPSSARLHLRTSCRRFPSPTGIQFRPVSTGTFRCWRLPGHGVFPVPARCCDVVEMSCAEHDAHAAETQFLTHTVGRMLALLELKPTPISTRGYETLLRLVDNTCSDSFDLYNVLFMYNKNATELLNRLEWAMDSFKRRLFDRLHDVLRKQLFDFVHGELVVVDDGPVVDDDDDLDSDDDNAVDGDESRSAPALARRSRRGP